MSKTDDGLRPLIRENVRAHWTTIETGTTEGGVPDLNGCLPRLSSSRPGVEFWIECKATKGYAVKFRPLQVGWLMTRVRHGGRAFVAVRRHVRLVRSYVDELYLFDGAHAGALSRHGIQGAPCVDQWAAGPTAWDWSALERHLRTHTMDEEAAKDLPEPTGTL